LKSPVFGFFTWFLCLSRCSASTLNLQDKV
jgi:hypothetical protein